MTGLPAARPGRAQGSVWLAVAGAWLAYAAQLLAFPTGPWGSDDALYWEASAQWLQHVPYIGGSHWALRHTLVLPLLAARSVFGDGMFALMLPSALYGLAIVGVLTVWTARSCGLLAAGLVAALVCTGPLLLLAGSTAAVDPAEALFILLAFALLARAQTQPPPGAGRRIAILLGAGVLAGLAMMSRETAIFAAAAAGLLFLAGYGMARGWYFVFGAGFLAVVAAEMAVYWRTTGNPLHRLVIAGHHDDFNTVNRWADQGAGVPILHPFLDPFTMLLGSHLFGITFLAGIPLAIWLLRRGGLAGTARTQAVVLAVLAVTWIVLAAGLWWKLPLIPRYYLLPAIACSALAGMAIARLMAAGWRRGAWLAALAMLGANLAGTSLDNRSFTFAEQQLVLLAGQGMTVHSDPETVRRASLQLEWAHTAALALDSPPGPGELYLDNFARPARAPVPQTGWTLLERRQPPPTPVQRLLAAAGLTLPGILGRLIAPGHPGVALYRAGPGAPG